MGTLGLGIFTKFRCVVQHGSLVMEIRPLTMHTTGHGHSMSEQKAVEQSYNRVDLVPKVSRPLPKSFRYEAVAIHVQINTAASLMTVEFFIPVAQHTLHPKFQIGGRSQPQHLKHGTTSHPYCFPPRFRNYLGERNLLEQILDLRTFSSRFLIV